MKENNIPASTKGYNYTRDLTDRTSTTTGKPADKSQLAYQRSRQRLSRDRKSTNITPGESQKSTYKPVPKIPTAPEVTSTTVINNSNIDLNASKLSKTQPIIQETVTNPTSLIQRKVIIQSPLAKEYGSTNNSHIPQPHPVVKSTLSASQQPQQNQQKEVLKTPIRIRDSRYKIPSSKVKISTQKPQNQNPTTTPLSPPTVVRTSATSQNRPPIEKPKRQDPPVMSKPPLTQQTTPHQQTQSQINENPQQSSPIPKTKTYTKNNSRSYMASPTRPSKSLCSFVDALANIVEEERLLEDSRRRLSIREDFEGKRLLSMIDRRKRGKFTFEEFRYFLGEIGVFHTDTRSLIDLYSSFDSNQNCLLGESELLEMLKPKDLSYSLKLEEPPNPKYPALSDETKEMIATCFNRLFSLRKTITKSRRMLKDANVDLNEIFDEIDKSGKGYLDREDFGRVIVKVIPSFKESELEEVGLFAGKCDLDNDLKVNFKDFYIFFSL